VKVKPSLKAPLGTNYEYDCCHSELDIY